MSDVKRVRGSPFTQAEKDILKEVVVQAAHIIENKKTDASSSREKKDAWLWVASTFNSYPNVTRRTDGQLRKAWENMKSLRKKEQAAVQQHLLKTGMGSSIPELPEDPLMELAVPHLLYSVPQEYDSDAIAMRKARARGNQGQDQSASPSFMQLTGTPILEEDSHSSGEDLESPPPESSLREGTTDQTTQAAVKPASESRHLLSLGVYDEPFPPSSCASDATVFGSSSPGTASLYGSSRRTSTESTLLGSRAIPSATVVRPPSTDSGSPIDSIWLGRDRLPSKPSATTVRPLSAGNDSPRESPTVTLVATTPPTTAVTFSRPAITGRRILSVGQDGTRSLPSPVSSARRTSAAAVRTAVPAADRPENTPNASSATNRLGVVREEHAVRMSQLRTIAEQKSDLHEIRLREARADAEAAELRRNAAASQARGEEALAQDREEELAFNRRRRSRLEFGREDDP